MHFYCSWLVSCLFCRTYHGWLQPNPWVRSELLTGSESGKSLWHTWSTGLEFHNGAGGTANLLWSISEFWWHQGIYPSGGTTALSQLRPSLHKLWFDTKHDYHSSKCTTPFESFLPLVGCLWTIPPWTDVSFIGLTISLRWIYKGEMPAESHLLQENSQVE